MLEYIYEWIENVAFYLIIVVAVIQMAPANAYKKYIRFFAGLILIFMLLGPICHIFGMTKWKQEETKKALQAIEEIIGEELVVEE